MFSTQEREREEERRGLRPRKQGSGGVSKIYKGFLPRGAFAEEGGGGGGRGRKGSIPT